jgi:hypothetical protein
MVKLIIAERRKSIDALCYPGRNTLPLEMDVLLMSKGSEHSVRISHQTADRTAARRTALAQENNRLCTLLSTTASSTSNAATLLRGSKAWASKSLSNGTMALVKPGTRK